MRKNQQLTLLGVWNQLPIFFWYWFCGASGDEMKRLAGRRLRGFVYTKDNLSYQTFFKKDTDALKKKYASLNQSARMRFIEYIAADYWKRAPRFESFLSELSLVSFSTKTKKQLRAYIVRYMREWPRVTPHAWYAVLFDIWFPKLEAESEAKKILAQTRDHLGRLHKQSGRIETRLYQAMARVLNVSMNEIAYCTPSEVVRMLDSDEVIEKIIRKAHRRMNECVFSTIQNKQGVLYDGVRVAAACAKYTPPILGKKKQHMLRGTPASSGVVRGRARVITLDSEFKQFQKGEILVAIQTMVHYVPLMKKASAILTELGGLTSHAAIVSRELKKPCIVGIPNLIASVKDGDLVKVDAQQGIVRKL